MTYDLSLSITGRREPIAVLLAVVVVASLLATVPVPAAADTEPNDDRESATPVTPGTVQTGTLTDGDSDWFRIDVERGESIRVNISNTDTTPSGTIYDKFTAWLRDTPGGSHTSTQLDIGENGTIGDLVEHSGPVYLQISSGGSNASYRFEVETFRTDSFEPNEGAENATDYTVGTVQTGQHSRGDSEWFRFDATRGEHVEVAATNTLAEKSTIDDFDGFTTWLFGPGGEGNQLAKTNEKGPNTTEVIGDTIEENGTHYVRLATATSTASWRFRVRSYRIDFYEPNERVALGYELSDTPLGPIEGTLRIGDRDYFNYSVEAGETVRVTTTVPPDEGQVETDIRTPDGSTRGNQRNETRVAPGETGVATFTPQTDTTVVLRFEPNEGVTNYTASVTVGGERIGLPNDRFERPNWPVGNQDRANATEIDSGRYDDLGMVDDDRDVFAIDAEAGERIVARTFFDASANDIAMDLVGPGGAVVQTVDTSDDGERLDFTATQSGTHYLRVTGEPDAQATYDLQLSVLGAVTASVGPGGDRIDPGTTATYDVILSGVQAGVGSVNFSVTSSDTSVLTVDSVSSAQGTARTRSVAGGLGVNLTGLSVARQSVTVAQVTVSTVAEGTATLSIAVDDLRTQAGFAYGQTTEQGTSLDVSTGPGALPGQAQRPTDPDGDGQFEDVDGSGGLNVIDVSILLGVFDRVPTEEIPFYDYNDDGQLNILDVAALLNET